MASDSTGIKPGTSGVGSCFHESPESLERNTPLKVPAMSVLGFDSDCARECSASFFTSELSRQLAPPSFDLKNPPGMLCRWPAAYKTLELRGSTMRLSTNMRGLPKL